MQRVILLGINAGLLEAIVDGMLGKAVILFLSTEPLLLGGGNNIAVDNKGCGRVVVES